MIRAAKAELFRVSRLTGIEQLVGKSRWRRSRLLILGYHGVSLLDEHEWDPSLYMSPQTLRRRFELLRETKCNVLSLDQALADLRHRTLPERAVVLTFDDGFFDFAANVVPLANEFGFPVTVYQSTYYSAKQLPVFPVALSYVLWKGSGRQLRIDLGQRREEMITPSNRQALTVEIVRWAAREGLNADQKGELIEAAARSLSVDYEEIQRRRILYLMTPQEMHGVAAQGASVELHTHRHRAPANWEEFAAEIDENRARILHATGRSPHHLCYPSGRFQEQYFDWLPRLEVESAVTCQPGLASERENVFALSRFIDTEVVSENHFRAWVSGVAPLLPRRAVDHSLDTIG